MAGQTADDAYAVEVTGQYNKHVYVDIVEADAPGNRKSVL
jgi:hypothetical protein